MRRRDAVATLAAAVFVELRPGDAQEASRRIGVLSQIPRALGSA
jgi:hypothetical protein